MSTDYERARADNDSAADAWLRGYSDAHNGRDVNPPEQHVTEYLRGYIQGLRARYGRTSKDLGDLADLWGWITGRCRNSEKDAVRPARAAETA